MRKGSFGDLPTLAGFRAPIPERGVDEPVNGRPFGKTCGAQDPGKSRIGERATGANRRWENQPASAVKRPGLFEHGQRGVGHRHAMLLPCFRALSRYAPYSSVDMDPRPGRALRLTRSRRRHVEEP